MGALCTSACAVVLLLLVGVAQGGGTPTAPTVAAAPSSSAEDSRQAELVRATERARLQALVEADVTIARRLSSDDLQVINPAGGVLGLEEYLGELQATEKQETPAKRRKTAKRKSPRAPLKK